MDSTLNHTKPGTVVLIHGLGRGPWSLKRIEWALRRDGHPVINLSYPSQRHDIATLAEQTLGPIFAAHTDGRPLHFVTHSLGGILLRQFLHDHPNAPKPIRVVMLGPPNQGSEVVDHLRDWKPFAKINGPAGLQLGTEPGSTPNQLEGLSGCEVGVIAGTVSLNPLFSWWIRQPNDGKVSIQSTRLAGMSDHIILRTSHTWMMWRGCAVDQIRAFLRTGRFTSTK